MTSAHPSCTAKTARTHDSGLLELAAIPYVAAAFWHRCCMDKAVANTIMDAIMCPLPLVQRRPSRSGNPAQRLLTRVENRLPYPIFVKPANAGSSVGITKPTP